MVSVKKKWHQHDGNGRIYFIGYWIKYANGSFSLKNYFLSTVIENPSWSDVDIQENYLDFMEKEELFKFLEVK